MGEHVYESQRKRHDVCSLFPTRESQQALQHKHLPLSRHFYKLQLYVMCMGVLPMCVPVCHKCARCPGSSEEGLRSQVTVSSRVGAGT